MGQPRADDQAEVISACSTSNPCPVRPLAEDLFYDSEEIDLLAVAVHKEEHRFR